MLVQRGLRIQAEIQADVNGRKFIPKLFFRLQKRKREEGAEQFIFKEMKASIKYHDEEDIVSICYSNNWHE